MSGVSAHGGSPLARARSSGDDVRVHRARHWQYQALLLKELLILELLGKHSGALDPRLFKLVVQAGHFVFHLRLAATTALARSSRRIRRIDIGEPSGSEAVAYISIPCDHVLLEYELNTGESLCLIGARCRNTFARAGKLHVRAIIEFVETTLRKS